MTDTPYVLALIPARSGSKGVPGKNIMELAGQPLIAYTIQQAQESRHINRIIVSTDGEDIARIAKEYGAEVPFLRPGDFAGDTSPDIEAFRHALEYLRQTEDRLPDLVVHLRPTGPIRRVELIDQAIEIMLEDTSASALRSVSLAEQTPYKMWLMEDNYLTPVVSLPGQSEAHSMARQTLPKAYWQNGYVDVIRPATILQGNSMVGDRPRAFQVSEKKYEIDYPEDVPVVEAALRARRDNVKSPIEDEVRKREDRHPV